MRLRPGRLPLRVRLVAGFVAAMLVLLTCAGAFVYWRVQFALDRGLDSELTQATHTIVPLVGDHGGVVDVEAADATGAGWQVVDPSGKVLRQGGPAPEHALVSDQVLDGVGEDGIRTVDVGGFLPASSHPYRVRITKLDRTEPTYLVVGVRRDRRDEALRELLLQLTVAGLAALAIASLVGDRLARAALRPVEQYRSRAAEITRGDGVLRLDVPPGRDDEVTRLGHTLNDMLAALEEALARERRFVDDASHELRTPLTLLKSRIQLARRRDRSVEEHERILDELAVDVGRLAALAEELLDLSSDAGAAGGAGGARGATADVGSCVVGVASRRRIVHPDQASALRVELPTEKVEAAVRPAAMDRIATNLVENAFAHGAPPVTVRVSRPPAAEDWVALVVEDAGPGMAAELLEHATGRFTRAPEARPRPGAGLGLAIVDQLVRDAGGELRLCSGGRHSQHGTRSGVPCAHGDAMTVTVLLPAASSADAGSGRLSL